MKKFLIFLFILLAASQAFAKKKKTDDKDVRIDSLLRANDSLRVHYDSLTMVNAMHRDSLEKNLNHVYVVFKEKVLKKDFELARFPEVIDSLIAVREASVSKFSANTALLSDSLTLLKQENMQMKATMNSITDHETARNRIMNELKQLKSLLDSKIITQQEYDHMKTKALERWQ